jgi:ATP-dependent Clp protease, protease subunit
LPRRRRFAVGFGPRFMVPYVMKRSPRGERTMDIYLRLLDDRIVFLGTPVDDEVANALIAQLLHLDSEAPEQDINLYVNSPGGSVTAGLAVYDTMRSINADVATTALGMAGSISAVLLAGGTRGKRSVLPNAQVLLHQPWKERGPGGQVSDIEIHAREIMRTKRRLDEILAEATDRSVDQIERDTDRDYIMSAQEAVEYGVADRVVTRPKDGAAAG